MMNYLNTGVTLRSWLLTQDHKRIAILYIISITALFALGGLSAVLFRLELITPEPSFLSSEAYNRLFTLHGVVMVWFFLIPAVPAVIGNFVLPLMLGAKDLAFPKINLASWYVFNLGAIITLASLISGGVDTGWTFYTPFSTMYSNSYVILAVVGVVISGFSSIMTALNFIVTTHKLRAPGLTWFRLPLFVWSLYSTSVILILATPVLTGVLILIGIERFFNVGIFDPSLGGDPLLFQHLFWFYSHPAVYIMILPSMGVVSELVTAFSRKRIFGYRVVAFSSVAIAVYSFLVWGHHMFTSGQSPYASVAFSIFSIIVAIPSAIKVFNWTATLYKGSISLQAPMIYALGFIGLFLIGGLTGVFVATLGFDVHVHDTYFVVAHFHFIMVGGAVHGYLGAIHFWWPKMSGRLYPERIAQFSAAILFLGFLVTFLPQFFAGVAGMPRRYHTYPEAYQWLHVISTAGASLLAAGYLLPLGYLGWSFFKGPHAGGNPWRAKGLEWEKASSPPSEENFSETPVVVEEAYAYGKEAR